MNHSAEESGFRAMRAALTAALHGVRGANPLVGAVLTNESGDILHVGWHRGSGTPHAEVDVLEQARRAGTDLNRTHLYVTLEPCNHYGRTGPCSKAIADAGIPKVTYAETDGTGAAGGAEFLASHGIDMHAGLLREEAHDINARWWASQQETRPFVTAKVAASLDGQVSALDGTSQWITGPEARAHGHTLRSRADAILVGTGTALSDNPQLSARDTGGHPLGRQPLRAVMGIRTIPAGAHLNQGPGHLHLDTRDPREALRRLAQKGIGHVLIEGGPSIISAFLTEDLVDEMYWYTAPTLLSEGRSATHGLSVPTLAKAYRLAIDPASGEADGTREGIGRLGNDTLTHLAPQRPHERK
ncbi:bifunctional diaminohydroxyphosphoribosylaminopyrimidine deaminase/5-amino-6-(5-phosphoribosylamino)uracil reductase RibD [Kocuria sp. HSID16901]|uniref:bifunctional diaminohydroxyphosphoribosylaminopyrimidine deaminase/5-amino-6-(5-phosphoribosylamino)uracil reductase RibD n=1 Tax=Kocuria sp. HSID16901 TaxID=2419505 RepID=UPI00069F25AB|nr:bifunctional diaminohydroxyphosphoribosylaminopyrimidine deaminase/5-amino-6-(5-phosphoribosylamino)uracil reductase RibD [Kocuria sp. HSID16901]RUQ22715.1 bifunctional diaminohydroxyphosphoribosylaminopyrimidine deaminase/5-amino-6-(5-phosphoribosylamino)uracil reductase RibD [Kocuria sp. HSID16901]